VHAAEAAGRVEALLARVAPVGEPFGLQRLQEALGLLVHDASGARGCGPHLEKGAERS
jgi:hypothetical protein